jgi:hypothetical protein
MKAENGSVMIVNASAERKFPRLLLCDILPANPLGLLEPKRVEPLSPVHQRGIKDVASQ